MCVRERERERERDRERERERDFAVQKQTNLNKTEIPVIDLPLLLKDPPICVFWDATKTFCIWPYLFSFVYEDARFECIFCDLHITTLGSRRVCSPSVMGQAIMTLEGTHDLVQSFSSVRYSYAMLKMYNQ